MYTNNDPKAKIILKQTIKRLMSNKSKPKYPIFYDIQPLIKWAFEDDTSPRTWNNDKILDKWIIQLRLTTLMRSADLANIVWGLFNQSEEFFVKTTNKMGQIATFSVQGKTLKALLEYLSRIKLIPGIYLLRHTKNQHQCLGSERLAKRALMMMEKMGVNTEAFKAHSLRGATATHLLKKNVPQSLVQARGGWTSTYTMDQYYSRLHQSKNWEDSLGGDVAARHSAICAVPSPTFPLPEVDRGRRRGGQEEEGTAQKAELSAHGILRDLYDATECPACGLDMMSEASYRCADCGSRYHVRCMGHATAVGSRTLSYSTVCFLCNMAKTMGKKRPLPRDSQDQTQEVAQDNPKEGVKDPPRRRGGVSPTRDLSREWGFAWDKSQFKGLD